VRTLTDWVLRHRLVVALAWLALAATGGALAPTTVDRLSYDFALPGQARVRDERRHRRGARRWWHH